MTITHWLTSAANELANNMFDSARLDVEIILAHTIGHPRTWLHAHGDETLDERHIEIANARLDLRLDHIPVAYIIGHKEFWGHRFFVNPEVLIPRPESEQMLSLLQQLLPPQNQLPLQEPSTTTKHLVDIGTGSGCLGISAKLTWPTLDVTLIDTSKPALKMAEKNANALQADVLVMESDLLENYAMTPDIVLANLPYVDESWERSPETAHEPAKALFASNHGLKLIERCFFQLKTRMRAGGIAIFEADPRQWEAIHVIAKESGFTLEVNTDFTALYIKQ